MNASTRLLELLPAAAEGEDAARRCQALFYQSQGFFYCHNLTSALKDLNECLRFFPRDSNYLTARSNVSAQQGRRDQVVNQLTKVFTLNPTYTQAGMAYFTRGLMLLDEGKWNEALADFDRTLRLNSRNYSALKHRVLCLYHMEETAACTQFLEEADQLSRDLFFPSEYSQEDFVHSLSMRAVGQAHEGLFADTVHDLKRTASTA